MPRIELEFEFKQTGVDVRQIVGQTETALARLDRSAGMASEAVTRSTGRADEAIRDLSRGAKAFGVTMLSQVNPALAQSAMTFETLARTSRLAGSAVTGGLVLAAAAGATALFQYTQRTNETIEFQTRLNESVRRFDLSGMTSQLKAIGLELEIEEQKARAFLGGLKLIGGFEGFAGLEAEGTATLGETLAETRLRKLRERQEQIRKEIERVSPLFFEQQIIGASTKIRSAQTERAMMAGPFEVGLAARIDRVQREERDAKRIIDIQAEIAKGQAASEDERIRISVEASFKRLAVEEEAKTKILEYQRDLASNREGIKAFGAGLAIEQQQTQVERARSAAEGAASRQAANNAFWKRQGATPEAWLPTVDVQAVQLIEEQKRARILAIDETLAKNLASIQRLGAADADRARLTGQANTLAETQRTAAIDLAVSATSRLYEENRSVRVELLQAAQTAGQDLAAGLDKAAAAAKEVAAETAKASAFAASAAGQMASASSTGISAVEQMDDYYNDAAVKARRDAAKVGVSGQAPAGISWEEYQRSFRQGVSSTGIDLSPPRLPPVGWTGPLTVEERLRMEASRAGIVEGSYDRGGVVPGPEGAPRIILAHGGEKVTPKGQGGNTFIINIDARESLGTIEVARLRRLVRDHIIPEIERATH